MISIRSALAFALSISCTTFQEANAGRGKKRTEDQYQDGCSSKGSRLSTSGTSRREQQKTKERKAEKRRKEQCRGAKRDRDFPKESSAKPPEEGYSSPLPQGKKSRQGGSLTLPSGSSPTSASEDRLVPILPQQVSRVVCLPRPQTPTCRDIPSQGDELVQFLIQAHSANPPSAPNFTRTEKEQLVHVGIQRTFTRIFPDGTYLQLSAICGNIVEEGTRPLEWVHDDERLQSTREIQVIMQSPERVYIVPGRDKKTETRSYTFQERSLKPLGGIEYDGDRPLRAKFQVSESYRRPDNSVYQKPPLTETCKITRIEHVQFESLFERDETFQCVQLWGTYQNKEYPGDIIRINRRFAHIEKLIRSTARIRKYSVFIDTQHAFDQRRFLRMHELQCIKYVHNGKWRHDDSALQSARIYEAGGKIKISDDESENYAFKNYELIESICNPLGEHELREGLPFQQRVQIKDKYQRPDASIYVKEAVMETLPIRLSHVSYEHVFPQRTSYQHVCLKVVDKLNIGHEIVPSYKVRRPLQIVKVGSSRWVDDKREHQSYEFQFFQVDESGAAIPHVPQESRSLGEKLVRTIDHINKSTGVLGGIGKLFKGKKWEIPSVPPSEGNPGRPRPSFYRD